MHKKLQFLDWYKLLTVVCFAVLQENDLEQADKYAELAMSADRYNPAGNQNLTRTKTTLSHSHALSAYPLLVCLHLCLPVCLSLCFPLNEVFIRLEV